MVLAEARTGRFCPSPRYQDHRRQGLAHSAHRGIPRRGGIYRTTGSPHCERGAACRAAQPGDSNSTRQRCSQVLRAWFREEIGPAFHFDAEMRDFFASADGTQTLQTALDHWRETRGQGKRAIDPQFEYNRFTRAWHENHPSGSREEFVAAWQAYRSRPIPRRGPSRCPS